MPTATYGHPKTVDYTIAKKWQQLKTGLNSIGNSLEMTGIK
jgi:hypothetical protein